MASNKHDVHGSLRLFKATHLLYTKPAIEISDAMKLTGYSQWEINCRCIRKSISKKKGRLLNASVKDNKKKTEAPTVVTTSTKTSS